MKMIGPIYNYTTQRWSEIDTQTDRLLAVTESQTVEHRITPDGVEYYYRRGDRMYKNAARFTGE
jgi:hypothetical protein